MFQPSNQPAGKTEEPDANPASTDSAAGSGLSSDDLARKARARVHLIAGIGFSLFLLFVGFIALSTAGNRSNGFLIAVGVVFVAGIVLIIYHSVRLAAVRTEQLRALCAEQGLTLDEKPDADTKVALFEPLSKLLTGRAAAIRWVITGDRPTGPVRCFQHVFSTDKVTIRTEVGAVAVPAAWPRLVVTREHLGHKIGKAFGRDELQLEDPDFNKRWYVWCPDESFAALVLSPPVQQAMMDDKHIKSLVIDAGWLSLLQVNARSDRTLVTLDRAEQWRRMLPPELDAWGPPQGS